VVRSARHRRGGRQFRLGEAGQTIALGTGFGATAANRRKEANHRQGQWDLAMTIALVIPDAGHARVHPRGTEESLPLASS